MFYGRDSISGSLVKKTGIIGSNLPGLGKKKKKQGHLSIVHRRFYSTIFSQDTKNKCGKKCQDCIHNGTGPHKMWRETATLPMLFYSAKIPLFHCAVIRSSPGYSQLEILRVVHWNGNVPPPHSEAKLLLQSYRSPIQEEGLALCPEGC